MGLYKRGQVWWMRFTYRGKQIFKSTETENKKQAQRFYDKVKFEIAEDKWFEKKPEHSFREMMDRYLVEHVSQKKSSRAYEGYVKNLLAFFGEDILISEITPSMVGFLTALMISMAFFSGAILSLLWPSIQLSTSSHRNRIRRPIL